MRPVFVLTGLLLLALSACLLYYASSVPPEPRVEGEVPKYEPRIEFYNYTYSVEERFLLKNELNRTIREFVYLSVPRNMSNVKSYVISIEPEPIRLEVDDEGNVFALIRVEVEPGGEVWIRASFRVEVSGYKIELAEEVARWPPLEVALLYTERTVYWDVENETLRELAYEIAYAESPLECVEKIARWISDNLEYEVLDSRLGSNRALVRRGGRLVVRGDCVEVADVFVTLARILGVPARTVYGFMLSNHEERDWLNLTIEEDWRELLRHWGGHMWIQVYIPPWGWIDVELLETPGSPRIGYLTSLHVPYGVEGKTFYGTGLHSLCIPSYLELEYIEVEFRGASG